MEAAMTDNEADRNNGLRDGDQTLVEDGGQTALDDAVARYEANGNLDGDQGTTRAMKRDELNKFIANSRLITGIKDNPSAAHPKPGQGQAGAPRNPGTIIPPPPVGEADFSAVLDGFFGPDDQGETAQAPPAAVAQPSPASGAAQSGLTVEKLFADRFNLNDQDKAEPAQPPAENPPKARIATPTAALAASPATRRTLTPPQLLPAQQPTPPAKPTISGKGKTPPEKPAEIDFNSKWLARETMAFGVGNGGISRTTLAVIGAAIVLLVGGGSWLGYKKLGNQSSRRAAVAEAPAPK